MLFVIDSLAHGGAERSLAEMTPRLRAAGVEAAIVMLYSREPSYEAEVRCAGVAMEVLHGRSRLGRVRELRRIVQNRDPDIVHTSLFQSDVAGRLAAVRTRPAVLTSLVNTSYEPIRLHDPNVSRRGLQAARIIDGWTGRHLTDHFHAVSRSVKESAARHLGIPAERITVVERGRDPARLGAPDPERRARARAGLALEPDARLVLNVGRQDFQKGQRYLLEAFEVIADSHRDVVLGVVGRPGHATSELEAARRRSGFPDRIRFLGPRDDVPELLTAADLFVSASLYEGLPGAIVEAMALGVPVVASDIPGVRDVVEDERSALLVPPEDPRALAVAMAKVLDQPSIARSLGTRGKEEFARRFTLDVSVRKMVALYQQLTRSMR